MDIHAILNIRLIIKMQIKAGVRIIATAYTKCKEFTLLAPSLMVKILEGTAWKWGGRTLMWTYGFCSYGPVHLNPW